MIAHPSLFRQSAKSALIAGCLLAGVLLNAAEAKDKRLITYPAPAGVPLNGDFAIKVRLPGSEWQALSPYQIKVDESGKRGHSEQKASLASFDFKGTVEVSVTFNRGNIHSARIRPLSYGIKPRIEGNTLRFSLARPRNLSIEVNGDIFHNLHLFANPLEKSRPNPNDPGVIYFGPGVHELRKHQLHVSSGQTVYLAGGAVLRGAILIDKAHNVRVLGRGMTDQRAVRITNSKDVKVSGVFASQFFTGGSQNVSLRNVKCISYSGWGDGADVICSSNVLIDGAFNRNSDDCVAIYAKRGDFSGGSRRITVRNSTLWADVAHPILIGTHGNTKNPETIEDLRFQNLDILDQMEAQLDYQGCMSINAGDSNLVRNVRFENIRVEDFRLGQLINLRVFFNRRYCTSPGRGIEKVWFKNIIFNGTHANPSVISGYDETRKIKEVVFENLTINGIHISDHMKKMKWFKTADMADFFIGEHVQGLKFR